MAAQPNLLGITRGVYTAAGLALIAWGFFGVDADSAHYALPVLGGILLIEGLIGYSMMFAAFGLGRPKKKE